MSYRRCLFSVYDGTCMQHKPNHTNGQTRQLKYNPVTITVSDTKPLTKKRKLDLLAYVLLLLSILIVIFAVLLKGYFHEQALKQRIQGLSISQNTLWLSVADKLIALTHVNTNSHQQFHSYRYTELGIDAPPVRMLSMTNSLWLQLLSGDIWVCAITDGKIKPCQLIQQHKTSSTLNTNYSNMTALPQANKVVLVNNFDANIVLTDTQSLEQQPVANYAVPMLAGQVMPILQPVVDNLSKLDGNVSGKLYRANQAHSVNIGDSHYFVQTDTGNRRLVAWQIGSDGVPKFTQMAHIVLKNKEQPYDFAFIKRVDKDDSRWLVLEGNSQLLNGTLRSYAATGQADKTVEVIETNLADPTLMAQFSDQSVLLAEQDNSRIVQVDFSLVDDLQPRVSDYYQQDIEKLLKQVRGNKQMFDTLSTACWLLFISPFIILLVLRKKGYKIGAA